jgi:predicted PurR-regulated permease PerM
MTPNNNVTSRANQSSLAKRMLLGAAIGLLLICFFLIWPKLWIIRPLIIVPLAGAMGGLCNYYIVHYHGTIGLNKTVAIILSVIVFIIGLWLGTVLGLDGTYWN